MEYWQLRQRQGLPLEVKIQMSLLRIQKWYEVHDGNVYISFSGGKDSTVLLHLIRSIYPDVKAVFCDTGLEYPELREHVKAIDNVDWIKPKIHFKNVIKEYGYPVISKEVSEKIGSYKKHKLSKKYKTKLLNEKIPKKWQFLLNENINISDKCCEVMKKRPFKAYEKKTGFKPFIGTMASEGRLRTQQYLEHNCNNFDSKRPKSSPLGFWTEQDILQYIEKYNLKIPSVYGQIYIENNQYKLTGLKRTGCMFCAYGVHRETYPNRFQRLEQLHPEIHNYCINKLGLNKVLDLIGVEYNLKKVTKEKYKVATKKITVRVDDNKFKILKKINGNIKNTKIIDSLIDCIYQTIDKRRKYQNVNDPKKVTKEKYKIATKKISVRVEEKKFNLVKAYLKINNTTKLIDYLIDQRIKSVRQIKEVEEGK